MELLVVAVAFAGGLEIRRMVLLVAVALAPIWISVGLAVLYWRQSRHAESQAAIFCEGVASELRSGTPLQGALVGAGLSVGAPDLRDLTSSSSSAETARAVGEAFPEIGPELEFTVVAAARGGSQAADLFDEIGSLAIAQAEVGHEVRVASAPARATAMLFVGAPTLYLFLQARSNRLASLFSQPEQKVVALIGLTLFLAGLAVAGLIAWRAR